MVLNNLRKTVEYYKQQLSSTTNADTQKLELLKGLPFYCDWIPNIPIIHLGLKMDYVAVASIMSLVYPRKTVMNTHYLIMNFNYSMP